MKDSQEDYKHACTCTQTNNKYSKLTRHTKSGKKRTRKHNENNWHLHRKTVHIR